MRIESVTRLGDRADKYSALFEDGTTLKVTPAQIADFDVYSGRELSGEEYAQLREGLEFSSAKARALRILGSRSLSASDMENRLKRKGESEEAAQQAVEWLENIGVINDEEYAAAIVRHYAANGYGKARIRNELFKRGIARDMWDEALSGLENMDDAADEFLEKRLKGSRDKDDIRRATDALCRRGFSYDEARAAVKRYLE